MSDLAKYSMTEASPGLSATAELFVGSSIISVVCVCVCVCYTAAGCACLLKIVKNLTVEPLQGYSDNTVTSCREVARCFVFSSFNSITRRARSSIVRYFGFRFTAAYN